MLGMGNLPELQGHFSPSVDFWSVSKNLSFPIHWGKTKCQDGSSWQPWLQRNFLCLVNVPGLVDMAKGW